MIALVSKILLMAQKKRGSQPSFRKPDKGSSGVAWKQGLGILLKQSAYLLPGFQHDFNHGNLPLQIEVVDMGFYSVVYHRERIKHK